MELYRSNFNAINVANKMSQGPQSLAHLVGTKMWWKRAMFGVISICEANAYNAYCFAEEKITRLEWREKLAYELVRFGRYEELLRNPAPDNREHDWLEDVGNARLCVVCHTRTRTRC